MYAKYLPEVDASSIKKMSIHDQLFQDGSSQTVTEEFQNKEYQFVKLRMIQFINRESEKLNREFSSAAERENFKDYIDKSQFVYNELKQSLRMSSDQDQLIEELHARIIDMMNKGVIEGKENAQ